jgi:transposase InsO family protein
MPTERQTPEHLGDHLLIASGSHQNESLRKARATLMRAYSLLGTLLGYRLVDLRASGDKIMAAEAEIEELHVRVAALEEAVDLLGTRWDKIPARERPHYTPEQRFRIVRIRQVLRLSTLNTAHLFRISDDTIYEWDHEARQEPESETIGSLVRPQPPVRRYADVVHHLVQTMAMLGFGGHEKVAEYLANAAISISERTVGRYRKEKPVPAPEGAARTLDRPEDTHTVIARFVGHVWMMDISTVPRLFGLRPFLVACVLDVFSRMPLAAQTFVSEPSAEQITMLFDRTSQRLGRPKHFVSDQGPQFTADLFKDVLDALRVQKRFGAVGRKGSIALIERFWRTIKQAARLRPLPPLTQNGLERRLAFALAHYTYFRPHRGLGGATPAEVFFAEHPAHLDAVQPPRARRGQRSPPLPVRISSLDREGRYPILLKVA